MSKSWASGSTRAWRATRELVLARDAAAGYRCRIHQEGWCANASPHTCTRRPEVVHHVYGRGRTGDDLAYLVSGCAPCNLAIGEPGTKTKPHAQPRTRWTPSQRRNHADHARHARRPAPNRHSSQPTAVQHGHITLVTGPPCAGKTHYVHQHAQPGDLILDQDDLGPTEMRRALASIHNHPTPIWVIRCCPGPARRAALAAELGATHIHLCPDTPTLLARAQQRPHPRRVVAAIRKWLAREAQAQQDITTKPRARPRTRWTTP